MMFDGHIHIMEDTVDPQRLLGRMASCGMAGGNLISLPPRLFFTDGGQGSNSQRLDNLMAWASAAPTLFPFYWIDPTEEDACEQVDAAVQRGVAGFKIICDRFFPGDARAMRVYGRISAGGKPILFHSGILWDGKASSKFNRPVEFEALLDIPGLRFSLAHIAWPWCDEMIAVYGKFAAAKRRRSALSVELFVDTTPGTPRLYRREALSRLMTVGYDVANHVFFGSDCTANDYDVTWTAEWIAADRHILGEAAVSPEVIENLFCGNLRRFVGVEDRGMP